MVCYGLFLPKLEVFRCLLKSKTDAITTAKRIKAATKTVEVGNGSVSGICGPVLMVGIGEEVGP